MPIQVAAHGFELTPAIKQSCENETKERLQALALSNFTAKWTLSIVAGEHVSHVSWADGKFFGDATAKTTDMYVSIAQTAKKAHEQMRRAHEKAHEYHKHKGAVLVGHDVEVE